MPSEEIIENSTTSILKLTVYSLTIDHEVCSHFVQWKVTTGQRRWVVPARASTDGRQRWTLLIKHSSQKNIATWFKHELFHATSVSKPSTAGRQYLDKKIGISPASELILFNASRHQHMRLWPLTCTLLFLTVCGRLQVHTTSYKCGQLPVGA